MTEHVFLVAVTVEAPNRAIAETNLHPVLPEPGMRLRHDDAQIESWWIAEDDRRDRSDCDAAVFVPAESGMTQAQARALLSGTTSSEFGEAWIVRIEYNTDHDGREIDPDTEPYPVTSHGPFDSKEVALEWMDSRTDGDTDVHDAFVEVMNRVRPA